MNWMLVHVFVVSYIWMLYKNDSFFCFNIILRLYFLFSTCASDICKKKRRTPNYVKRSNNNRLFNSKRIWKNVCWSVVWKNSWNSGIKYAKIFCRFIFWFEYTEIYEHLFPFYPFFTSQIRILASPHFKPVVHFVFRQNLWFPLAEFQFFVFLKYISIKSHILFYYFCLQSTYDCPYNSITIPLVMLKLATQLC